MDFAGADNILRLMSDCEEADFFWESWTSPGKIKRKKEKKKNKGQKCKNNTNMKTNKSAQKKKKKKNSKFKEAVEGRTDNKKEKKKKKLAPDLDDSFLCTCGSSAAAATAQGKPEASNLRSSTEKPDQLIQDSKKKTKRKKKMMFDLSPGNIRVRRPKFVSSSPQSPRESIFSENEAVKDGERCSQVTETGQSQGQPHDNDSQCTSDDMNSQDLFITQKKFRKSPANPSSGEASDKSVIITPQMFTQRDRELTEGSRKANGTPKKEKLSFQTWSELNINLTEEKDVSCPSHARPSVVNPYLSKPTMVNTSLDVAKSKKRSCTSSQQDFSCPPCTYELSLLPLTSTVSASTQTENFFTTELSSYLNFRQKITSTVSSEDLKPLDLSLPQRVRKDDEEKYGDQKPSCLLKEIKSESGAQLSCSSEARAVQMRLNEYFFFKTKGEGQSPRPESPLMKLSQSSDIKSRKRSRKVT